MKKIVIALITCFSFMQSLPALTSALNESILEYQAILGASNLIQAAISQSEFIVDVERKTKSFNASTVFYEIKTFSTSGDLVQGSVDDDFVNANISSDCDSHHRNHTRRYSVRLLITPNPAIGPSIIQVISIEPISRHTNEFFGKVEADQID